MILNHLFPPSALPINIDVLFDNLVEADQISIEEKHITQHSFVFAPVWVEYLSTNVGMSNLKSREQMMVDFLQKLCDNITLFFVRICTTALMVR